LRYTTERAQKEVDIAIAALAPLPASKYRDALVELAQFAVRRRY
jgi:octaprenyl-diphosphate synthase